MTSKNTPPSFSHPLDAIVLAGTHRNPKRTIMGQNKAFLTVDGRPLLRHVVEALLGTQSISRIFAVGPVDEMTVALDGVSGQVQLVPQEGNVLTNCWAGIHASDKQRASGNDETARMRPFLIISSDLPLVSSASLDDFVARCADEDLAAEKPYGLMVGVADEPGVAPYYPDGDKPGIVRPFVELEFARVRLANIYVARPWQLTHQEFLQTGFDHRKAVKWRNVVSLAFSFLTQEGGLRSAWLTMRLQATLLAARRGGRLYRLLRRGNTRERVEAASSTVLGGPLRFVVTPFGSLSLDVDDEADFQVFNARYHDWMAINESVRSVYQVNQSGDDQAS
jgi:GTP:adenosylcobinamide-phosphate guanylyltransferase